jgi:phospho-N-acetylmuramoyl-pentapeptide-transferase
MDDFIKVVLKRAMGLRAWQKMGMQIIVTASYAYYLYREDMLGVRIPFGNGSIHDLGFFAVVLVFIVVLGTVNGANFTDGVDGLASSVTAVIALFFVVVSSMLQAGIEPIAATVFGALLGFLLYNLYPAKVFMGDTGSLALGGFVVASAYSLQIPLFIPMIAIIYLAEVISVILQVGYFKLTHGKRIFKMAPLHHHYEKSGWSETKVVGVFTIVTILMCFIGLLAL